MASVLPGNVVSLGDHPRARARLSPQESAGVLTDCRDLAIDRIAKALGGMLDHVEDELFELAEKAGDREAQNLYLDARARARERRPVIESTFRRHFLDFFNRKVQGEEPGRRAQAPGHMLALVDDEELEQSLAVSGMATRLKAACEDELGALSQRFGFLMERPELADEANPISPEAICSALKDACDQIEAGWKVRLTLLRVLEGHVATDLQRVYHDLNAHLVARQILPEIRPSIRRAASSPATAGRGPSPATGPGNPAAGAVPGDTDVYSALAQLLAAGAGAAPSVDAATLAGLANPGAANPNAALSPSTRGFVQVLTQLHQPEAALAAAGAVANVIRDLKAAPQSSALAAIDAMTIDIVAMLFDYIFDDRQIPAEVKAILGRLQIPMLKVALLDKAFFSSKAHPARRLLDRLAQASIGLEAGSGRGKATLAKVDAVVSRVLLEFDTDIELFATLASEMEAFQAAEDALEQRVIQETAKLMEERERLEIARSLSEEEIDRRLAARGWVPEPVRAMLEDVWVRALATVHAVHGDASAPWSALLAQADELLWSVEPKHGAEDRRRLVSGLPLLLSNLQEGMRVGGADEARLEAFFGALVDCHSDAVKAGLKGTALASQPKAQDAAPAAPLAVPSIERAMVPLGELEVEEVRLKTPRGASAVRNVFTRTGIWTNLPRNTWVEFRREGAEPLQARLTWISPAKGVYLFTNSNAKAAMSISPEALAEQMRRGEARILDGAPLVDRAVDSMLANLREKAA